MVFLLLFLFASHLELEIWSFLFVNLVSIRINKQTRSIVSCSDLTDQSLFFFSIIFVDILHVFILLIFLIAPTLLFVQCNCCWCCFESRDVDAFNSLACIRVNTYAQLNSSTHSSCIYVHIFIGDWNRRIRLVVMVTCALCLSFSPLLTLSSSLSLFLDNLIFFAWTQPHQQQQQRNGVDEWVEGTHIANQVV